MASAEAGVGLSAVLEHVDCTSCGSAQHVRIGQHGPWGVRGCARCGLRFVSPRPPEETTHGIYDRRYFDGTGSHGNHLDVGGYQANASGHVARARHLVPWVMNLTGVRQGRWLDLGCGPGHLLSVAREFGFEAVGVDVSPDAVRYGRERLQLELHEGAAEQVAGIVEEPVQIVSMIDTLFHLREPREVLSQVALRLTPGGWLFAGPFDLMSEATAGTPEHTELEVSGWGIPEHLSFVNQVSMDYLLRDLGFEARMYLPMPLSPSDLTSGRLWFLPAGLQQVLRSLVRRSRRLQAIAHQVSARSVNPRAGYVLARWFSPAGVA